MIKKFNLNRRMSIGVKRKAKYQVTEPEYMDCPNPTEPDLIITIISNIIIF